MSNPFNYSQDENLYIKLREQVVTAGLLEKQPVYYWFTGILILGMIGLGFYLFLSLDSFVLKFLSLFLLAFAMVQGGLWGHDLAHHQIFKSKRMYNIIGILCWNLFLGVSFGYWNYKHNRHHAHPNTIDEDNDIRFPVLWFAPALARGINYIQKKMLPYQKYYFLPLLILPYTVQLQNSISFFIRQKTKRAVIEGFLFFMHHALVWFIFFGSVSLPLAIFFLAIYHSLVSIYLGIIFSPNHYGMPILKRGNGLDYFREQIFTTRNITPGIFNDILYGGLNYQIEHHLFPIMPRKNLRKARELVKKFCKENSISYHETGTIRAFKEILNQLDGVSRFPTAIQMISNL